jgi:hypothetical protein
MSDNSHSSIPPRLPTADELRQFSEFFGNDTDNPMPIDGTCIAVFDGYQTDGPGYVGKVAVVVWPAGPDYHHVLIWNDGVLKEVERE